MDIDFYINEAQKKQGVSSLNKLSPFLGITTSALANLKKQIALPADSTILKLANLAGIPAEQALIDVSLWRNKDNPEALAAWQRIQKKLIKS